MSKKGYALYNGSGMMKKNAGRCIDNKDRVQ